MTVLLEIAITSTADARAAGGAGRLELNAALALGGLTPSLGVLRQVRAAVTVPLVTMIRPRAAGFAYSADELAVMADDIETAFAHGTDEVALGCLRPDGRIDGEALGRFMELARGRVVCHRAFDLTPDPLAALDELMRLGVRRVMTSGQQPSALAGAALIRDLIRQAAGRIEVLPAGGINRTTARELIDHTCCTQLHAGLRGWQIDPSNAARPGLGFRAAHPPTEGQYEATDAAAVAELLGLLRHD